MKTKNIVYLLILLISGSTFGQISQTPIGFPTNGNNRPVTPATPSVTYNCGSTTLTRANPPSGTTWYWQNNISGTGTTNAAASITRTSGTTYYLRARNNTNGYWSGTRVVKYTIKALPAAPPSPSVVNHCGYSQLTQILLPGGNLRSYWQSSPNGTSTANSNNSIKVTSGNVSYLRMFDRSTWCWSPATAINYSIRQLPLTPSTPTVINNCGSSVLTRANPPSGTTWYWQNSRFGTSTTSTATLITRTNGNVYYLRAKNNTTGCWSTARTVNYTIKAVPTTPTAPTVINNCGSSTLTRSNPPSGITWYWQSSTSGASTAITTSTITRTSGTTYYLRAKNNTTGCWSAARTINYKIKTLPVIPTAPTVANNCGASVLTRANPPSGITWYWQNSAIGKNLLNANKSITRTSGTTYYLRAKNNTTGCWSTTRTVNYTIKTVPTIPTAPTVANNCGSSILTRSNPPSGITWYWQSTISGTSTAIAAASITRTSGTTYYLRARNNANGCWSTTRTVNYASILVPAAPPTPSVVNKCGYSQLTQILLPGGNLRSYWQNSPTGTSKASSENSIKVTSGNVSYLRMFNSGTGCWSPAITINYAIKTLPATPAAPRVVNNCGTSVLTRTNPPSGITWYWQNSRLGTSTTSTATSITRTSGATYYLRAKNNTTGCWSTARTVNYTIKAVPVIPTAPTVANNCGSSILTRSNPPSGITWYWQNSTSGTSTAITTSTITRASGTTYYLRAKNNTTGCWSVARTINYKIKTIPAIPTAPTVANNCGASVLTRANPPSGITWYWQNSAISTNLLNANKSITRTSGTTYYLRAKNNTTGCWSTARTVNYTIKTVPTIPTAPTVTNNCGVSVLTRANPPSGITWYWQSTISGTSTTSATASITRTTGTIYYLRARNNANGCWSAATTVNYVIKTAPAAPPTPSVVNNCGYSQLTQVLLPGGNLRSYWQSSPTGISKASSENSIKVTSGNVSYLRMFNSGTGCWSPAITINYSIIQKVDWYLDADNDGYAISKVTQCIAPSVGYVQTILPLGDCDDSNPAILLDIIWYLDADQDGYGDSLTTLAQCPQPDGYVSNNDDCNDTDATINPEKKWHADVDNDGFGDPNESITQCIQPLGYVSNANDLCPTENGSVFGCIYAPYQNTVLSENENYIFNRTYQKAMTSSDSIKNQKDVVENITYFDGLGRVKQQIAINQSPNFGDIINYQEYDQLGRQPISFLPTEVANNLGTFYTDAKPDITEFYNTVKYEYTTNPYSQQVYESSPSNRILEQASPGESWKYNPDNVVIINPKYIDMPEYHYGQVSKQWYAHNFFNPELTQSEDNYDYYFKSNYILVTINRSNMFTFAANGSPFSMFQSSNGPQALQLGEIDTINIYPVIENLDLGNLVDSDGNPTTYRLKLINNTFVLSSDTETLQKIESLNTLITIELNSSILENYDAKVSLNKTIKFDYQTNIANEVINFDANGNGVNTILVKNSFYPANTLFKNVTKDENWQQESGHNHTTEEFTDKSGKTVLKRTYNDGAHDTYYVYDKLGNLSFVIPPKVTKIDGISAIELAELCYQYRYDERNRLIEKKIPGKGWEHIVYNNLNQPVLTQDANQRKENSNNTSDKWLFTKYDALGRVTYTGIITDDRARDIIQTELNDFDEELWVQRNDSAIIIGGTTMYYTDGGYPNLQNAEVLTINYYDNYEIGAIVDFNLDNSSAWEGMTAVTNAKGLPTVSQTRILETNNWITNTTYYDKKGRAWKTHLQNDYLETEDWVLNKLDFVGKVLLSHTTHTKGANTITTIDTFTYDHIGRMLSQKQKINDQPEELITYNLYDELGQLERKKVGNTETTPLQNVDYRYNVRGWLTGINNLNSLKDDLFSFKINYDNPEHGATALFNGNISETEWKTANDRQKRWYTYDYDPLNRITSAINQNNQYNLYDLSYDKNGNILALKRTGNTTITATSFGAMDNLIYTYDSGNKLKKVKDLTNIDQGFRDGIDTIEEYMYDANGNMTVDHNKGITGITYNYMNLPTGVSIANSEGNGNISYIYDATGAKLKKIVTEGSSFTETEYAGNYVYENGQLQFFNTTEGYVEPNTLGGFDYVYQYKDHLGNIRLSYSDRDKDGKVDVLRNFTDIDGDGDLGHEILQEKNYYPFGLTHKGYNNRISGTPHNYGYNGKEENDELGLGTLDYGARNYDPTLGRWFVIDALSDDIMQVDKSTYAYSWNSPISLNDPDGNCPWCLGAVIGAVSEYAVQVTVNLAKGQSLEDAAFNNVDFLDVGAAAVEGALTVGASAVRRVGVRVASEVVKAAIDVNGNGSTDVIGTEGSNKTVKGLVVDTVIGVAGAEGGDKIAKGVIGASSDAAVKSAKSNVTAAAKNLDKANNIVYNGGKAAAKGSNAKSVGEAFTSFSAAKEAQAVTKTLNNTVGQVSEDTVKATVGTVEGTVSTAASEKIQKIIE